MPHIHIWTSSANNFLKSHSWSSLADYFTGLYQGSDKECVDTIEQNQIERVTIDFDNMAYYTVFIKFHNFLAYLKPDFI